MVWLEVSGSLHSFGERLVADVRGCPFPLACPELVVDPHEWPGLASVHVEIDPDSA
ncbi:hypothetical protein D3C80_2050740 [compost metagenome]